MHLPTVLVLVLVRTGHSIAATLWFRRHTSTLALASLRRRQHWLIRTASCATSGTGTAESEAKRSVWMSEKRRRRKTESCQYLMGLFYLDKMYMSVELLYYDMCMCLVLTM